MRHIYKSHGDVAREAARGQRAIKPRDYAKLPALLNNPDVMRMDGEEVIVEKVFGGYRYIAVFGVLRKRRMLNLKSMRIIGRASSRSTS